MNRTEVEKRAGTATPIELDGERVAVGPDHAVMIPPGAPHRAIGRMTILNVVGPPFDPADEWFDRAAAPHAMNS